MQIPFTGYPQLAEVKNGEATVRVHLVVDLTGSVGRLVTPEDFSTELTRLFYGAGLEIIDAVAEYLTDKKLAQHLRDTAKKVMTIELVPEES